MGNAPESQSAKAIKIHRRDKIFFAPAEKKVPVRPTMIGVPIRGHVSKNAPSGEPPDQVGAVQRMIAGRREGSRVA